MVAPTALIYREHTQELGQKENKGENFSKEVFPPLFYALKKRIYSAVPVPKRVFWHFFDLLGAKIDLLAQTPLQKPRGFVK